MPRKLRLEFPGACYHVINRGNYRADVFASEGARFSYRPILGVVGNSLARSGH